MAMSLALIPSSSFEDGVKIIEKKAKSVRKQCPGIIEFVDYLRSYLGPLALRVTKFGVATRTYNNVETFHRHTKQYLGGTHPHIWRFLGTFLYLSSIMYIILIAIINE